MEVGEHRKGIDRQSSEYQVYRKSNKYIYIYLQSQALNSSLIVLEATNLR